MVWCKNKQAVVSENKVKYLTFTHNLQFYRLPLHFNSSDFEIHSNSADVALCVGVILK